MANDPPVVLVHGAFQSGATWDLVAPQLSGAGRRVFVAALAGLGPASSPLSDAVSLETHVRDVVAQLEHDDLHDVVLVGHSYAGIVVTGAAELAGPRIRHLVYVDALVPEHGQSGMDLIPQTMRDAFRKLADEGGGWRMRPNARLLDLWGLEEGTARRFVEARLCDFTIRCFEQPLNAPTHAAAKLPRTYVASVKKEYPARAVFEPFAARARREGWGYHELEAGHDAQAERPQELSKVLLSI